MANTPISGFTSGAPAQAGDEYVIARSGSNFKITAAELATYMGTVLTQSASVGYTIDGNGNVITTGIAGSGIRVPFAGTITGVTLLADTANGVGTIEIDILKGTYSGYTFTTGSIIPTGTKPFLSNANKYETPNLTGWTTSFSAGDVFRFQVTTNVSYVPASVTNLAIIMSVTKS